MVTSSSVFWLEASCSGACSDGFRDDDPVRSIADIEQTLTEDEGSLDARGDDAPAETRRDRRGGALLVARWLLMKASTALFSIDSSAPLFSAEGCLALLGDDLAASVSFSVTVTCGISGLRSRAFLELLAILSNGVAGERRAVGLFFDEDTPPSARFGLNVCG